MSKIAFPWYGGKFSHLSWLLPLLPHTRCFVDVFGGSGAVLLNRERSEVEVYNDISGDVVHFFRILRDRREELIELLKLTPHSREEFEISQQEPVIEDLERARRFFVRARQVRRGKVYDAKNAGWQYSVTMSRRGISGRTSAWLSGVDGLSEVADRLLSVQIEKSDFADCIKRYDTDSTLFYCDPPYPHPSRASATNAYGNFEMDEHEHGRLSYALLTAKGKVAVSGYHGIMDELYHGWDHFERQYKSPASKGNRVEEPGTDRTEVLWVNY